jgi:2,3-dihydroxybenzoate decarboxylase
MSPAQLPSTIPPALDGPLPRVPYKRIATEEAFGTVEIFDRYKQMLAAGGDLDPGFRSAMGYFLLHPSPRARSIAERLVDLDDRRIGDMDAAGIDLQLLSLTSPGVQIFDADTATALAVDANDRLAAAIARHPARYTGLTAIAPQDPAHAAREIERGMTRLGLKGVIVNSHTHGEYLDDPKFWPIFEAAEALDAPIYLHPNTPSRTLIGPMLERGLDVAIFGFQVETSFHALSLIVAGVFDRFPKLTLVLGHLGEGLPYWMSRIDHMHGASVGSGRYANWKALQRRPSEYLRQNVYVTTSGMPWAPAIAFAQQVLGIDRVMYAMDYPYQYFVEEVAASDSIAGSTDEKTRFFQKNAERVFKLVSR